MRIPKGVYLLKSLVRLKTPGQPPQTVQPVVSSFLFICLFICLFIWKGVIQRGGNC